MATSENELNSHDYPHDFCDHCPLCQPILRNVKTGRPLPEDDPLMIPLMKVWNTRTTYAQRRSFILVTRNLSAKPSDVRRAQAIAAMFQAEAESVGALR